MRLTHLILPAFIAITSCGRGDLKNEREGNGPAILFVTAPVQSPSLLVKPTLTCFTNEQRMELTIKLKSLVPEKITINEISINNANGLNSSVESIAGKNLVVPTGRDTTLLATFRHINDKKLFHATGLPGLIDSTYNVSVFYTVDGKEGMRVVNLVSKMSKETFLSYRKAHDTPVQIYVINTADGFNERQKQFLVNNRIAKTSPFVHITEQEVAVAGLNFRIKCFHTKDSLYTEMFIVNHSDMAVKIDTSKIDVIIDGMPKGSDDTNIGIEKVTGSKDDVDILAKGDRMIIQMRRKVAASPKKLVFAFVNSFSLTTGKALFSDDLHLIRLSDSKVSE